ncbi:MAG: DUF2079 domain-containing protein [Oscillospiraceae bacterium]|nr:DUF2079 domain-containing protein [Oscillospiraceae bacterium]
MSKQKKLTQNQFTIPSLVRHALLSWLLAVVIEYLILPNELRDLTKLDGLAQMSFIRVLGIACGITALLTGISFFVKTGKVERWFFVAVFSVLAITALRVSFTWAFLSVCLSALIILVIFGIYGWDKTPEPIVEPKESHRACFWITVGLSVVFFLFVSAWTAGRVYSFSSPTFDFGIFCQMFYNMKESGLPMTTVERDGLLSHFAVHVSPIYFSLLPFYWLVPTPATLQVLQAAVITSAVIPLWKIGKHHGLTGAQRMLVCAVLLLYPAYSGGTSYDLHENCFLTPLILWLLYGIDKKNALITGIAAFLTLMVKEDAAVYVAVIALWLIVKTILRNKQLDVQNLITGIALLSVSLVWFFVVTGYLAKSGDGVMTYRYKNFMYDGSSSLITVIKSVILNPMKAVYECVDSEKLYFIAMTLLPLLGLPLLTRRYERYILLIPYILVNLMSDYRYQHDIFFQYTFGSNAFLLYLTIVNLADLKINRQRIFALVAATIVSTGCFGIVVVPKAMRYPVQAITYYDYYQNIRDTLDQIPDGVSVTASTFYTTHLSQREILYDIRYCSRDHLLETEYVVLRISANSDYKKYSTGGEENGFDNLVRLLQENGYGEYALLDNVLVIYQKAQQK